MASSSSSPAAQVRRRFWEQAECHCCARTREVRDVLPDAENIEEDSRSPAEMEGCPEPRMAQRRKRARRARRSGGGAHVSGWELVRKLLWRTRPKPERARHKAIES